MIGKTSIIQFTCHRRHAIAAGTSVVFIVHSAKLHSSAPSAVLKKYVKDFGWAGDEQKCVKPKGMHWRTYHRLVDELAAWEHRSDVGLMEYTIKLLGGLDAL